MPIKYYVSSKLKHRDFWLNSRIKDQIVSSWIYREELTNPVELGDMWTKYLHEIQDCDEFLIYLEPDDIPKGCLIEMGAAFALGKPIDIVWSGTKEELRNKLGTIIDHWFVDYYTNLEDLL